MKIPNFTKVWKFQNFEPLLKFHKVPITLHDES